MKAVFEGKSAFITGAGSGLGRAAALTFARNGIAVVAVDINPGGLEETVGLVQAAGGTAYGIKCDMMSGADVDTAFSAAVEACGTIDMAFNNAGVAQTAAETTEIGEDQWDRIFAVNVKGVWHCMRNELRHMAARGSGVIVNTASLAGIRTIPGQSAYVASKHAVVGLTKNAAIEYAARGVRVNAICPGGVRTAMYEQSIAGLDHAETAEAVRRTEALHPMMRIAEPEEVAEAALYLCSPQAGFITGVCLPVDGGWAAS